MKLYTYFRSSAAYRVRIALNLKGLPYESVPVHLVRGGGEQHQAAYRAVNPAGLVPALVDDAGQVLTQSLAIIEYLEETHPTPALLPSGALDRARVRALAQAIACDTHPLNNTRVLQYLGKSLGADESARQAWYRHWVAVGLGAVERLLAADPKTGDFCHGDTPGLADCCLVPQVFNARRFDCDLSAMPMVERIVANCERLPAFQAAAPAQQPDAE
ncbi:MAG: maleylacetoacetate isomerase [Lautropia sp.]|nr:maleylacetoacetate isomerase [Lautropia sp.]